jgi:methylated-DNA-[protein]-cysteine S-methyltransferase
MLIRTSFGWLAARARRGRLVALSLPAPTKAAAIAACGAGGLGKPDSLLSSLADELIRYFAGEAVALGRYPVDLSAHPPFRRRALLAASKIPYGEVRTYGWVASRAGRPRAGRAAGQAMSRNPIPLVIPCHRVIAAGGRLGGFGGGLKMKRALLQLEGLPSGPRGIAPIER